jgi:hypothetical protein
MLGFRTQPWIVILVHKDEAFAPNYFLYRIAEVWREAGCRVDVLQGPGTDARADLAVLHVDLTRIPDPYLDFIRRFPRAINAGVSDISKRRISTHLVNRGDGYAGPVIVKTDRNSGGIKEAELAARRSLLNSCTRSLRRWLPRSCRSLLNSCTRSLRRWLPWSCRSELDVADYPIFDSASLVPDGVWRNPHLVVERYLPEIRDGFHCLRTWVFLGDRETHSLSYARHRVVKLSNIERREVLPEVPAELRERRRQLGFDFGKFDYVLVDGRPVLFDANRTPSLGSMPQEQYMARICLLAEGLQAFL